MTVSRFLWNKNGASHFLSYQIEKIDTYGDFGDYQLNSAIKYDVILLRACTRVYTPPTF
jgi:hypothetical protein